MGWGKLMRFFLARDKFDESSPGNGRIKKSVVARTRARGECVRSRMWRGTNFRAPIHCRGFDILAEWAIWNGYLICHYACPPFRSTTERTAPPTRFRVMTVYGTRRAQQNASESIPVSDFIVHARKLATPKTIVIDLLSL